MTGAAEVVVRNGLPAVPSGPLLVLSPHFDDAALSCAALLARSEPFDVITVFGGEPDPPRQGWWDRFCGFGSSTESIATRKREEEEAIGDSGHRVSWLSLLEGQYLEDARPEGERNVIREAVLRWSARSGGGTVVIPAGAGRRLGRVGLRLVALAHWRPGYVQHPDHLFVRDTMLEALQAGPTLTELLYEELPYLWTAPADRAVSSAAARWGFGADPLVLPVDRRAKVKRLLVYASQLPYLSTRRLRLDDPDCLPQVERYWRLERRSNGMSGRR